MATWKRLMGVVGIAACVSFAGVPMAAAQSDDQARAPEDEEVPAPVPADDDGDKTAPSAPAAPSDQKPPAAEEAPTTTDLDTLDKGEEPSADKPSEKKESTAASDAEKKDALDSAGTKDDDAKAAVTTADAEEKKDEQANSNKKPTAAQRRKNAWRAFAQCRVEARKAPNKAAQAKALRHCRAVLLTKLFRLPGGAPLAHHERCVHAAMKSKGKARHAALRQCGTRWKSEVQALVAKHRQDAPNQRNTPRNPPGNNPPATPGRPGRR